MRQHVLPGPQHHPALNLESEALLRGICGSGRGEGRFKGHSHLAGGVVRVPLVGHEGQRLLRRPETPRHGGFGPTGRREQGASACI